MKKPVLYILMRNDLPSMNAGKAMAQASHASNAFIAKLGTDSEVQKWQKETGQGFGTVLVLSVSQEDISELAQAVKEWNYSRYFDEVVDPTYPYRTNKEIAELIPTSTDTGERIYNGDNVTLFRSEVTCAYIFGDKEDSDFRALIDKYPLHP